MSEELKLTATAIRPTTRTLPGDFEEVFRAHHDLVYRTAYRITGNPHDAEDVLQTLFLRLLRRECPPDIERNPKGYLHRAAVNIALDIIKVRNRNVSSVELEARLDDPASTADHEHNRSELQQCLRAALSELSPRAAEIFVLRHVEGYGNAQIAKLIGASRGTVAVTLFRARAQLRRSIRKLSGEKS
jgi:RNA polymerase sigma-70 factor (ECF subfamily)